jgi:hypothetical protein
LAPTQTKKSIALTGYLGETLNFVVILSVHLMEKLRNSGSDQKNPHFSSTFQHTFRASLCSQPSKRGGSVAQAQYRRPSHDDFNIPPLQPYTV